MFILYTYLFFLHLLTSDVSYKLHYFVPSDIIVRKKKKKIVTITVDKIYVILLDMCS